MEDTNNIKTVTIEQYNELKDNFEKAVKANKQLLLKINEMDNIFNILPYYIEVVKNANCFSEEFVQGCQSQLNKIMLPASENKEA